jgi:hypothetical protein
MNLNQNILGLPTVRSGPKAHECENSSVAWLFVSLKNRQFTRAYMDWFIDFCESENREGVICLVDSPYRFNKMAELAVDQLPPEVESKHSQISREMTRKIQKALNGKKNPSVRFQDWGELEAETPNEFKAEVLNAFQLRGSFYTTITSHVASMKNCEDIKMIDRLSRFFLAELPVLFYAYYRGDQIMDVYPGEQPVFFRQFEEGLFDDELPLCTKFIKNGDPFVYLQTFGKA